MGVSLTKVTPKRYGVLWAFGLDFNGADQMGEREVALPAGVGGNAAAQPWIPAARSPE